MKHAGNDDGLEEENERKSTHDHQYVKKITRNDFTIWQLLTHFAMPMSTFSTSFSSFPFSGLIVSFEFLGWLKSKSHNKLKTQTE